jgi:hypothetical protein
MLIIRSRDRQERETVFRRFDGEGVQASGRDVIRAVVEDGFLVIELERLLSCRRVQVRDAIVGRELKFEAVVTGLVVDRAVTGTSQVS